MVDIGIIKVEVLGENFMCQCVSYEYQKGLVSIYAVTKGISKHVVS